MVGGEVDGGVGGGVGGLVGELVGGLVGGLVGRHRDDRASTPRAAPAVRSATVPSSIGVAVTRLGTVAPVVMSLACLIPNPSHDDTQPGSTGAGDDTTAGPPNTTQPVGSSDTGRGRGDEATDTTDSGATSGPPTTTGLPPVGSDGFPDPLPPRLCDPAFQQCARGFKCNPYSAEGSGEYDSAGCFDVVGDLGVGADCQSIGLELSGLDECDVGLTCLQPSGAQDPGQCAQLCDENRDAACGTDERRCVPHPSFVFAVCRPVCNPIVQNCPGAQACYVYADNLVCLPITGRQAEGEPCAFASQCSAGLACIDGDQLPSSCIGAACCTPFCELGVDLCGPGQSCTSLGLGQPASGVCTETS